MKRWMTISWWLSAGVRIQIVRAGIGALVGAAFTLAMCTLGESARGALIEQLLGGGEQVRAVQPRAPTLGGIDLVSMLGGQGALFDDEDVQQLQDIDGVAEVWPEAWSRFPVFTTAEFPVPGFDSRVWGEVVLLGVPYEAVAEDLDGYSEEDPDSARDEWSWEPGEPVPVAIPRSVIAAYNSGFQPAHADQHWPKIDHDVARLVSLELCPGKSILGGNRRQPCEVELQAEIIAVTPYAGELAAIVPLDVVHWIGSQLDDVENPEAFSSVLMTLETGADPEMVQSEIERRGWDTQEIGSAAKNLALALRAIDLGVGFAGSVIVLAALILLAQVYSVLLRERRKDIRVLRALGSSRGSLGSALVLEVGIASFLAALVGVGLGVAAAMAGVPIVESYIEGVLGTGVQLSPAPPAVLAWGMIIGIPTVAMLAVSRPILQSLRRC